SGGRYREAEPLIIESLAGYRQVSGDQHRNIRAAMTLLAHTCLAQGKLMHAKSILEDYVEFESREGGDQHPNVAAARRLLAQLSHLPASVSITSADVHSSLTFAAIGEPSQVDGRESLMSLATSLCAQGDFAAAEALLLEVFDAVKDDPMVAPDQRSAAIERIVDLYESWHAADPDKGCAQKATAWRAKLAEFEPTMQPAAAPLNTTDAGSAEGADVSPRSSAPDDVSEVRPR
ncbi:MAG TPA: tetratricopeptide repeat protein, partial [Phycisphaerae bacterium]